MIMLLKSDVREVLQAVLVDHLADTEVEEDLGDIVQAILDRIDAVFGLDDDELLDTDEDDA